MVNPMNKNNEFHVLEEIVDRIHDCWFDADSIQSAKEANEIDKIKIQLKDTRDGTEWSVVE